MIAAKAKVSRATVSQVLGGKYSSRYRPETRERILAIARELNYRSYHGARTMKTGRSNLIAIVHFGMGIEAAQKTNLTLARLVNERGYDFLAIDMNWCGGCMDRTIAEIIHTRAEGVIVSHIQEVFEDRHVSELRRVGIPVVSVNGSHRVNAPLVFNNAGRAIEELTRHLLKCGHRRILQPVKANPNPELNSDTAGKRAGFRRAVEERGRWVGFGEEEFFARHRSGDLWGSDDGVFGVTISQGARLYDLVDRPVYRFCKRLFSEGELPDAIVCMNDFYAMEAVAAGLECGVSVPGDVAVTGYDNDRIGELPAFGLTTAEQATEEICAAAMEILVQQIAYSDSPVEDRAFDSRLVIRTSCGVTSPLGFPSSDVSRRGEGKRREAKAET